MIQKKVSDAYNDFTLSLEGDDFDTMCTLRPCSWHFICCGCCIAYLVVRSSGRCLLFQLLYHFRKLPALLCRFLCCRPCLFSNRDDPLDVCRIIPQFCFDRLHILCRLFSSFFSFSLHDVQRVLYGGEIGGPECLAHHGQRSRNHGLHEVRRHSLA